MSRIVLPIFLILLCGVSSPARSAEPWPRTDAAELLAVIEAIGSDGLDPADYDMRALQDAISRGGESDWSERASAAFLRLAGDLGNGHLRDRSTVAWHIDGPALGDPAARGLLARALATHEVRQTLMSLVPQHRQYRLLKAALATTPPRDKAGIERLRANLERWRWMPRDLGTRYLLVNVPAFTVSLVDQGRVIERRRVIVGKRSTPTPQFAAKASGVVFNPWWQVPESIVRESVGALLRNHPAQAQARGYVMAGGRYRQAPGPDNALGQVKLVMPNPYSVYLHDTPSKPLFDQDVRAFSHGCIRVQDAAGLAASLLGGVGRREIDQAIAEGRTVQSNLASPLPIYVAYFTAAIEDNGDLATFPDIYGRDGPVVASLVDRELDEVP
ncbi:L,D-transpeptidase family protein [Novosphingobium sp. G106]|uniref:L,D-transpeptidase family protein n=1 Tax=Novosphingobium sp. G106 TaxID=2849500 RepID=UPI001C2D2E77|nr:L,D-transpeptidase family protein [Novosphingobium sp. G106]MBV1691937.1 L,D-transpeptidase family protein [Novosphingobium sp. G106]